MSKFYYKKVLPRYSLVVAIMTCIALAVLGKAFYTMTAGRAYWMAVASQQKRDSVKVMPLRGNILSCDGQLMASSLPEFKMYMDFDALKKAGNDTAFVDSINYMSFLWNQFNENCFYRIVRKFTDVVNHCRVTSHHKAIVKSGLLDIESNPVVIDNTYKGSISHTLYANLCRFNLITASIKCEQSDKTYNNY